MNAPTETLPRTYESLIQPLRKRIDTIDAELILILLITQEFIHHKSLWEAVIYTILSDEGFEEHRTILTTILRTLKSTPKNGLSILHHHDLEWDEMLKMPGRINSLLSERFRVVREVGALKWEFHQPAMNEERWNYVLTDRKTKWIQSWWENAETIIPTIWNPIHEIALKIEQEELKKAPLQHWMDENGMLSDPYYETWVLETRENPKLVWYGVVDTMEKTLVGCHGTLRSSTQPQTPIVTNNIPREFFD